MNQLHNSSFIKFLKYLKPYWWHIILLFLLLFLATAASLASPYFLKILIDEVFPSKDYKGLSLVLSLLVVVYFFRIGLNFASTQLDTWISNRIVKTLREDLFNHLLRLPLDFFLKNRTGDILSRIGSDVSVVQRTLTDTSIRFVNNIFGVLAIVVMLCFLNWKLFLVVSIIFPISIANVKYFHPKIRKVFESTRKQDADITDFFFERFNNIKLIKTFNAYQFEFDKLSEKLQKFMNINLKSSALSSFTRSISVFLMALSPILVFGWGGKDVILGAMTLGALVAFLQYLNRLHGPFEEVLSLYVELVKAGVSMDRILEFFSEKVEDVKTDSLSNKSFKNIQFENIAFNYLDSEVLKEVNFKIEKGKKYALVGDSGSGKSTVINLLMKFYKPTSGTILMDDVSLEEINLENWREKVLSLSQETYLFNDSIDNNITYSMPLAIDEARIARELMELPMNDDAVSNIGDQGTGVSGGQRQKLALARAYLRNPELLIFDEATSALDSNTERRILENLFQRFSDKTFLIISHRISTIKNVDTIFVLHKGKIAEIGNHQELVAKRGIYFSLFQNQIETTNIAVPN